MHKEHAFRRTAKRRADDSVHAALSLAATVPGGPDAYLRLLHRVRRWTDLLRPPRDPGRIGAILSGSPASENAAAGAGGFIDSEG